MSDPVELSEIQSVQGGLHFFSKNLSALTEKLGDIERELENCCEIEIELYNFFRRAAEKLKSEVLNNLI